MQAYRVYMLNSFSRSGETMLLRALAAHPMIRVAHDLNARNSRLEQALVGRIRNEGAITIGADDPVLGDDRPPEGGVIVVKNAVWTHAFPCPGFVLARNPFSIVTSLAAVEVGAEEEAERAPLGRLVRRLRGRDFPWSDAAIDLREKIERWSRGIDARMAPFANRTDPVSAIAVLWARKMLEAHGRGGPILRYETFVHDPEPPLRGLLAWLGLPWDDAVLSAHERYPADAIGHGGIRLGEPITAGSQDKYKAMPLAAFHAIYAMTAGVMRLYGYAAAPERNLIVEDFDDRFDPPPRDGTPDAAA